MKVIISPSKVTGTVMAPASKSAMQRACALALMKNGRTYLKNAGRSNDDVAALDVIQKLGARVVDLGDNNLLISSGENKKPEKVLNCGESGLGLRMFTPLAALNENKITITGSGSLATRPMDFFDEVLPKLSVEIDSNGGRLPITIKGPLEPTNITIDGSLSSQFLTGLMIAFATACTKPVSITVQNLKSKPYIDLTLHLMKHFGYQVENDNYEQFHFHPIKDHKEFDIVYSVESDWSGGAFLLVAGAIAGSLTVKGLDVNSTQADKKILEALKDSGAKIEYKDEDILVEHSPLKAFSFDATDCPDLFPPLVALASFCEGVTTIKGVSRLKHKESDRGKTLQSEFSKLGVEIQLEDDLMKIKGVKQVNSITVHSNHDHRIAMACAVAALRASGPVEIEEADAINKSYPTFYAHLDSIKIL